MITIYRKTEPLEQKVCAYALQVSEAINECVYPGYCSQQIKPLYVNQVFCKEIRRDGYK